MALALYRKYRPATFAQVVGQEHVTVPLSTAVDSGRINHAYLFSGPRGCGKTSSARILARSLNCEKGPTSTPCGECQSCIDLAPDGSGNIDVIEIDAASHGGVDDARDLRERAFQLPVASRYKIYIIDEAHMVSNQGFNALLKVVEEPPESVVFIFATTEPDKVLPTIRSRTHHYPFRLVPPSAMRALLEKNCASEGVQVQDAVIPLVVRAGGGSVRDSQSLLDQLIAGAGPGGISYEEAVGLLGVTDLSLLEEMIDAIAAVDGATVFATVNRLVDAGHDPRRFAADLLDRLRDLILVAAVPDAIAKGLVDVPTDQAAKLSDQAQRLGLATLSRLADIVHDGLTEMRGTTTPRLGLELICARMLIPEASGDGGALVQRVDRLERRMSIGGAVAPAPEPESAAKARPQPQRTGLDRAREREAARAVPKAEKPTPPPPAPEPEPTAPVVPEPPAAEVAWPEVAVPGAKKPAAPEPRATTPEPEPEAPAPASADYDVAELRRLWPKIIERIRSSYSRPVTALIETATPSAISGNTLSVITVPGLVRRLADPGQHAPLVAVLTELLGVTWTITVSSREDAERQSAAPAPSAPDDEPEPDPEDEVVAGPQAGPVDPEAAALTVLREHLGAEPLDES